MSAEVRIEKAPGFGRLSYGEPNAISNAIDYAKFHGRSHNAVISVYDEAANVIQTNEHAGEFKEWVRALFAFPGHSS